MTTFPIQISFHDVDHSDAVEAHIREKAEKLSHYYDRIIHCRVTVEMPRRNPHRSKLFNIRVDVSVPGSELVVDRNVNEDVYLAIRNAFDNARRRLEDYARRHRGEVKHHDVVHTGTITRIFVEEGYGFLRTPEGPEIYFHRNSVTNDGFDRLGLYDEVHFVEEMGDEGPQAMRVARLHGRVEAR